ncbi:MAG: outer membrane protein assembly factor BamA [Bdellovibrionales bacterium GWA2_49_15]|nr:MAG: outer membrane protein assembly factor BamA [Bdellovibrionales bacterium GWA2_49_15]HAZ14047.1 outer membrane protein assembly factor BamA [Bdellovibrionales bacterium]
MLLILNLTHKKRMKQFFIFHTILSLFLCVAIYQKVEANVLLGPKKKLFRVKSIEIQGQKKVEKEAILEKIGIRPGMELDTHLLRRDIEKIYSLKYFETVTAEEGPNGSLIFIVKERPIISKIIFEGNSEIDTDDLKTHIKTKDFSILDINSLKQDAEALQKHYEEKGFYLAYADYRVKASKEETVEVTYEIKEFDKVRVKNIIFLGNKVFSDAVLKDIMETREESLFSFMSGSGNFKEFNFQTDVERIKYFYKTKGHLQVNVGTPEVTVSEDKKWVFITMKVNEGPKFSVNDITFQGELLFPESEIMEKLKLRTTEIYSEETLREDIQTLTELYQDQGYAFANVLRTLHVVPGANKVDIEYSFEKGKMAYFGKIIVKGNTKTRDKVVRRELKIREGTRFSGTDLRKSRENVNRLGFFEQGSVVFNTVPRKDKDDVLDVEINVKERNTGQISVGAGYSTATGAFMQASIAQNNFMGYGQNLSFGLSLSSTNKTYNVGFTEPYLFDTKWTAGFDVYSQNNEASSSFSYKRNGLDLRVGHPIAEYTRIYVTYRIEDTQIRAVNDPTVNEAVENGIASVVRTSIVQDKRDNAFEPSSGYYVSLAAEYAGVGGDKRWYKSEGDGRYFNKIWGDLVFRSRLFTSKLELVGGRPVPRAEKFTLGGARNLRGYNYEAIGPKRNILVNGYGRPFNEGGLFTAYSQLEFEHPLAREAGLKWVVFFDAGDANNFDQFKAYMDYGFGLRWFSPIGVLRFEFGYPLNPGPNDAGSQFHFDIGQLF